MISRLLFPLLTGYPVSLGPGRVGPVNISVAIRQPKQKHLRSGTVVLHLPLEGRVF